MRQAKHCIRKQETGEELNIKAAGRCPYQAACVLTFLIALQEHIPQGLLFLFFLVLSLQHSPIGGGRNLHMSRRYMSNTHCVVEHSLCRAMLHRTHFCSVRGMRPYSHGRASDCTVISRMQGWKCLEKPA